MRRNRRQFLGASAGAVITGGLAGLVDRLSTGVFGDTPSSASPPDESHDQTLNRRDHQLLDDIIRTAWTYFMENGDPETGLVRDRSRSTGPDDRPQASLAAVGFGLTVLALAPDSVDVSRGDSWRRIRKTIRFLHDSLQHHHGFFYHFVHWKTGARYWDCELSSIDTSLCLMGVLVCGECAPDIETRRLCRQIHQRVNWKWLTDEQGFIRHGWKPESGFLKYSWNAYSELLHLYMLAIGAPDHPVPPETWDAIERRWVEFHGRRYIGSHGAFFVHQFSHAWIDFRNRSDRHTNYFTNSVNATLAHRSFCLELSERFPGYEKDIWGITASDSRKGYVAWGGPPLMGPVDGTVVPCAAAGSLPFAPRICLDALHAMREGWGDRVWSRYGFVDAFHPVDEWFNPDVIGIDVGISALMALNLKSGAVWKALESNTTLVSAFNACGFSTPGA
jgi:hypothetical protein